MSAPFDVVNMLDTIMPNGKRLRDCTAADIDEIEATPGAEEKLIAARREAAGRACGDCSMCCYVLSIKQLNKPIDKWCTHCRPGKGGCSIYADRPPVCRNFACQWLVGGLRDDWYPKHSRMVVHFGDAERDTKGVSLFFDVDRRFPNRWREEPYYSDIKDAALRGLKSGFRTYVIVGERRFLVLPHREVECERGDSGVLLPTGPDQFEYFKAKSLADGQHLKEELSKLFEMAKLHPAAKPELETKFVDLMIKYAHPPGNR